jgi:single-strand DNA-binding protein
MTDMRNRAQVIGHLGNDPAVRTFQDGGEVVSFSLATTDRWTDARGGPQQRTEWHRIVIFNDKIGEIAKKYLRKGSQCGVEGKLQTRSYTKDGVERSVTEIVLQKFQGGLTLLDRGQDKLAETPDTSRATGERSAPDLDDDVPF